MTPTTDETAFMSWSPHNGKNVRTYVRMPRKTEMKDFKVVPEALIYPFNYWYVSESETWKPSVLTLAPHARSQPHRHRLEGEFACFGICGIGWKFVGSPGYEICKTSRGI